MDSGQSSHPGASCPFDHQGAQASQGPSLLEPADVLTLPLNKRIVTQYATLDDGATELRLYYDDKEISFDEPELFAFGEQLALQSRFSAHSATEWGQGYDWPRVRGLLMQLIEEDVLRHADENEPALPRLGEGARPSALPPAPTTRARTWYEVEDITRELTGTVLSLGHLELVIPIFRVAHMALDADGRQVGESNVFPKALRIEVPTSWRTCIYSGTRYQVDRPMNVTALKAMRAHWAQMMAVLLILRGKYLQRFPEARQGWTVGHLERLSTLVLTVPTFALMRTGTSVANGTLHPALSSLFRVTDGVRMTMHQMLFVPVGEPTLSPDAPMTSAEIYAYAERNYSFHSEHGVCAGPKSMVEEFLGVLVDGQPPRDWSSVTLDDDVRDALARLDDTTNYALHGLRAYAAVFSLWPIMARAYEDLASIAAQWPADDLPAVAALSARLQGHLDSVREATYLATEQWRADREAVYADMYEKCGAGLRPAPLTDRLATRLDPRAAPARPRLLACLDSALRRTLAVPEGQPSAPLSAMASCIADFLLREQAVIAVAEEAQAAINTVLGRAAPTQAFNSVLIDLHNQLQGTDARRLPYLINELEALLGLDIMITSDDIRLGEKLSSPV